MKRHFALACLLAVACSQESSAKDALLAIDRPETKAAAALVVASPDFAAGGAIPLTFSAYGEGRSPALAWSGLPAGTKSLALMMEDPDAVSAKPYIHWLAWNIPPAAGGLARGSVLAGMVEGRNSRGSSAYFGPRPHGAKPHHYHFQLFALDTTLPLPSGTTRAQLLAAIDGHVLAKGEIVGLFAEPKR